MGYSVTQLAKRDINNYNLENFLINSSNTDRWNVSVGDLFTPETKKLNRLLGVSSINYKGNTNGLINYRKTLKTK